MAGKLDLCRLSELSGFVQRPNLLEVHLGHAQVKYRHQSASNLSGIASCRHGESAIQGNRILSITLFRSDRSFAADRLHRLADHAGSECRAHRFDPGAGEEFLRNHS